MYIAPVTQVDESSNKATPENSSPNNKWVKWALLALLALGTILIFI